MTKFMVAVPFPAGNKDKWTQFAAEALGPRRAEQQASRTRLGITEERCWIQQNPDGTQTFILYLVGRDPVDGNRQFAASSDPYDLWFKRDGSELLGIDLSQPIPVHPPLVYESAPPSRRASQAVGLVLPILAPASWSETVAEVNGPRRAAHDAFHARTGVAEDWYTETTPQGELVLVYLESEDLAAGIAAFAQSREPHDVWMKDRVLAATGMDWNAPPPGPLPELVFDYQAR